ncbi:hypothetical protein AT03_05010 [Hafnia alvei FB1]|uniref:Uncharacterized protein n=1 Tax=Hafnia alvei FB1 TaxID=1453496 RepID=A0A097QZC2_HAFAL|nr:hypothetical protein AT03_05010 [Hafnia alvei FB1]
MIITIISALINIGTLAGLKNDGRNILKFNRFIQLVIEDECIRIYCGGGIHTLIVLQLLCYREGKHTDEKKP